MANMTWLQLLPRWLLTTLFPMLCCSFAGSRFWNFIHQDAVTENTILEELLCVALLAEPEPSARSRLRVCLQRALSSSASRRVQARVLMDIALFCGRRLNSSFIWVRVSSGLSSNIPIRQPIPHLLFDLHSVGSTSQPSIPPIFPQVDTHCWVGLYVAWRQGSEQPQDSLYLPQSRHL